MTRASWNALSASVLVRSRRPSPSSTKGSASTLLDVCSRAPPRAHSAHARGCNRALSSAYRLLTGEEAFGAGADDVALRHRSSLGQTLRSQSNRFFVPFPAQALLTKLGVGASLPARVIPVFRTKRITLFLKSFGNEEDRWEGEPPEGLAEITFDLTCRIVRVAELERFPSCRWCPGCR